MRILYDIGFNNDFFHITPKTQATKVKIDKLDHIKTKNFCASKDMINSEKATYSVGENICKGYISDKKLISRIYKESLQFNYKTLMQLKMHKGIEYKFLQR